MPHRPATCVNSDARHWVAGPIECGGRVSGRIPDVRRDTPRTFIARTVRDEAEVIYTDDLKSYLGIGDHDTHHETVHHAAQEWGIGDVHTNSIEGVWSYRSRSGRTGSTRCSALSTSTMGCP